MYKSTINLVRLQFQVVKLSWHCGFFHFLGFGDCTLQSEYAGGEEIFSTLRDDENTHRDRLQWVGGIKSNHAPSSLTNKWIETVKVIIVMDGWKILSSKIFITYPGGDGELVKGGKP